MILPLALALSAFAQGPAPTPEPGVEVVSRIEPDTILVGAPLALVLSLTHVPEKAEIVYPLAPDTGLVTALAPPRPLGREGSSRSVRYELAIWAPGEVELTLDDLRIVTEDGERLIPGPHVRFHVASVLPDDADPDTLAWQPPGDVIGPNWSAAEKLAAAALALATLALTVLYVRWRGRAAPLPIPPPRPPRERALTALERLERSGLLAAAEFKAFYSEVARVLRTYLVETDGRWGLDRTTAELLPAVHAGGVDEKRVRSLAGLLVAADMVKFARSPTSRQRAGRLLDAARLWIAEFERRPTGNIEIELESGDASTSEIDAMAVMDDLFAELEASPNVPNESGSGAPDAGRGSGT
jgi:hypothetical protein